MHAQLERIRAYFTEYYRTLDYIILSIPVIAFVGILAYGITTL